MSQDKVNALLFLFVEQKLTSVNIDCVIDELKNLIPVEHRLVV